MDEFGEGGCGCDEGPPQSACSIMKKKKKVYMVESDMNNKAQVIELPCSSGRCGPPPPPPPACGCNGGGGFGGGGFGGGGFGGGGNGCCPPPCCPPCPEPCCPPPEGKCCPPPPGPPSPPPEFEDEEFEGAEDFGAEYDE